jgi:hypothetical protein
MLFLPLHLPVSTILPVCSALLRVVGVLPKWKHPNNMHLSLLPPTISKLHPTRSITNNNKDLTRGSFSTKSQLPDDPWVHDDGPLENQSRTWQRAFRSLFQNFCNSIRCTETSQLEQVGNGWSVLLDTYYYVLGVGHIILSSTNLDLSQGHGTIRAFLHEAA